MNTREKLIVYGGGAICAAIIIALAVVWIAGKLGYIDPNDWFFPPGGGIGEAYLRLGGLLVAVVALLVTATFCGKAVQRIISGEANHQPPGSDGRSDSN